LFVFSRHGNLHHNGPDTVDGDGPGIFTCPRQQTFC
jgi:hypothetical protein